MEKWVRFNVSAGGRRFVEEQPVHSVRDFKSLGEQIADEYAALYPAPTRVTARLNLPRAQHKLDLQRT